MEERQIPIRCGKARPCEAEWGREYQTPTIIPSHLTTPTFLSIAYDGWPQSFGHRQRGEHGKEAFVDLPGVP
jgi:hypothetical protein